MFEFKPETLTFIRSLPTSELMQLLSKMPRERSTALLAAIRAEQESSSSEPEETRDSSTGPKVERTTERDRDVIRKREARASLTEIRIPAVVNEKRREAALADPVRFLLTYFPERYTIDFGRHHLKMIEEIVGRARYGGRQAIAAPRGSGKSELAKGLLIYLLLAEVVRFPIIGAATGVLARRIFKDIRSRFASNDLLFEDFPEVCAPVRALDGAPQRAARQHVAGELTGIVWTSNDYIQLPATPGSTYGGAKLSFFGLDSAFRGTNIDGDRPDFVLVDDPETQESARSPQQVEQREESLDRDISGLVGQDGRLAIVVLTTVQNSTSLSARLTDRKVKPSYNGLRFGMIEKWPKNMPLWEEYISRRHAAQRDGDEHAIDAVDFYLSNREAMDKGVEMLTDYFVPIKVDGRDLVVSAVQAAFNKIAETSLSAFRAEYQNDPEPEEETITGRLTAARVQGRTTKVAQREIPEDTETVTLGIDVGKYRSHWTKIAWGPEARGTIVDYGVIETVGLSHTSDNQSIETAILSSLEIFAEEQMLDGDLPDLAFIDSGTFTAGVYAAARMLKHPFYPVKGYSASKFRMPSSSKSARSRQPFLEAWSDFHQQAGTFLFHVNSEYWKQWVHDRFLVDTFDGNGERNGGTLALYDPGEDRRRHLSFAHHITAEELRLVPSYGREHKREWFVKSRNNHWLDATAYAAAAGGAKGVRVIVDREESRRKLIRAATPAENRSRPMTDPYGRPFVATNRE